LCYHTCGQQSDNEGYVIDSSVEERKRLTPDRGTINGCNGRIINTFRGKRFGGTGVILRHSAISNGYYLITCAHNFVKYNKSNGQVMYSDNGIFKLCLDKDKYESVSDVLRYEVHPRYADTYESCEGFDVAVAFVKPQPNERELNLLPSPDNCYWDEYDDVELAAGDVIFISGYPGAVKTGKSVEGQLWGMQGAVYQVVTKANGGKLILYKDLDTSPGQSGSVVWHHRQGGRRPGWHIVGVHVCWDGDVNVAICLTPQLWKWVVRTSKNMITTN